MFVETWILKHDFSHTLGILKQYGTSMAKARVKREKHEAK